MPTYSDELSRILRLRLTKIEIIKNAYTLAAEADRWRAEAERYRIECEKITACCDRAQQMVRDLLADAHRRNDELAARVGVDLPEREPDPDAPPPKGVMH